MAGRFAKHAGVRMTFTSTSTSSTAGKGCATLFFSVFALVGLVFTAFIVNASFEIARTYFWDRTDCTIEASSVRKSGDSFDLDVRYSYRVQGRSFTGTRFRGGMSPSMDAGDAERARDRYAPGTGAVCYVDPSVPQESILERGSLWLLLIILFPLIFVAIGVGGIIGIWRAKPAGAKAISEKHRSGVSAALGLRLFGLVFMLVGGGLLYVMLIRPTLKEATATKWPTVPCEITSSGLGSHRGSKGSTTYSVEIRYHYEFRSKEYTGSRYNFDTGSSSSREWRSKVVAQHPPGRKTVCFVNPEDPYEAVLSTAASSDRWFGLIPAVFLIVGLFVFFKAPAMGAAKRGTGTAANTAVPAPLRGSTGGPVELKPSVARMAGCITMLIIALFWNGIVWTILLNMGRGETFGRIFLSIFALIGVGLIGAVVYQFLALFNPRPVLTANSTAIPLGGTLEVQWRFTGNVRRLRRLCISLDGREEATCRRGTTTTTDRIVFANLTVAETTDRGAMAGGNARLTIPAELMHTFTAPNNKIVWTLRVAGDIPKWPDVSAEFPISVLPREPHSHSTMETSAQS